MAHYKKIATWMETPRLPGEERAFTEWLNESEENQLEWQQWEYLRAKAKRLYVEPLDIDEAWGTLRDSLGLRRQRSTSQSSGSRAARSSGRFGIFKEPIFIALLAMVLLSLFFYGLYVLRNEFGF